LADTYDERPWRVGSRVSLSIRTQSTPSRSGSIAVTLGADAYLAKVVDMPELMVRIQILLARHAQQGEAAQPAPREASSRHA